MKKLFYSTLAVLTFSVSGMSNTIEIEETKNSIIEDAVVDCYDVAEQALQEYMASIPVVMNHKEQYSFFATAYDVCVGSGKCTNCLQPITISANLTIKLRLT